MHKNEKKKLKQKTVQKNLLGCMHQPCRYQRETSKKCSEVNWKLEKIFLLYYRSNEKQ